MLSVQFEIKPVVLLLWGVGGRLLKVPGSELTQTFKIVPYWFWGLKNLPY